jgi:hypothetical protein
VVRQRLVEIERDPADSTHAVIGTSGESDQPQGLIVEPATRPSR